ncbi:hypothetical protein C7N43_06960 [Sphingobacteriales bacterium UPWRP_1]|nr:hypothetical protein BVG80_13410 [Sphingobacteriales bacterium TSM_CSM]PSJ77822.1 hypothetical protein C7N43_06960 [Sphingobacteriales bacterium UPWRP_1]
MELTIYTAAFLLVLSKFLDCWTTSLRITHLEQEKNPLARFLMRKIGIQTTIWFIFAFTTALVLLTVFSALAPHTGQAVQWAFVLLAAVISVVQFAVAYTNYYGKLNPITRFMLKRYKRWNG